MFSRILVINGMVMLFLRKMMAEEWNENIRGKSLKSNAF
jgi:hypothetical protein